MYVDVVPNRSSPPAVLLRESWREGGKVHKRTLANISDWSQEKTETLRRLLRDETLVAAEGLFRIVESLPHGHVQAVLQTLRAVGLEKMISARASRERDLVVAMIVAQLLHGSSKLADTRLWHTTTLAQELGLEEADANDLYGALDWLLQRQGPIEQALARRHLAEGGYAFYDLSNSYYEGRRCPLARLGYGRDGKAGRPVIAYGVLADQGGRPVGVEVYAGNAGDPATVADQVGKLREHFHLKRVVLVGDRGMLTQTQIESLKAYPGLGWISALRSPQIRALIDKGALGPELFDESNLAEISGGEYAGERLIACYNPLMAEERRRKRLELLQATETTLRRIQAQVQRRTRTPLTKKEIALKVGRVIGRHKMAKHFQLTIEDNKLEWTRRDSSIEREQQLDGIYIVRTSEAKEDLSAADAVRQYKNLRRVERIFRTFKGLEIMVRPIRHRVPDRVRAHILLCMLAYYVEWHMRDALAPLLYQDEELERSWRRRDPVAKAVPSPSARRKKRQHTSVDGLPLHSFADLLKALSTLCRNKCTFTDDDSSSILVRLTEANPLQRRAFELLAKKNLCPVNGT